MGRLKGALSATEEHSLIEPAQNRTSPPLIDDLVHQRARWQEAKISAAAYAASYFLLWQMHQHGAHFASRNQRYGNRPDDRLWRENLLAASGDALDESLIEWFGHTRFFKIIPSVPIALRSWLLGDWPLTLLTRIPSPRDVLDMQTQGTRPVTVINDFPRAIQPVLSKANGFQFLVHDLEHAWKFCHDATQHQAQRHFFRLLQRAHDADLFATYLHDAVFTEKFDYLISDMNTHPVHGLRYFHAVLVECLLRQEGKSLREPLSPAAKQEIIQLIRQLAETWALEERETHALLALTDNEFTEANALILEQYFFAWPTRHRDVANTRPRVTPNLVMQPIRLQPGCPRPTPDEA